MVSAGQRRVKRGWLSPIDDLANLLFDRFPSTNAQYSNNELDKLYNRRITPLIQNETTIVKGVLTDKNR
jgi:hypothetical protein